jgi:hypothetical protein
MGLQVVLIDRPAPACACGLRFILIFDAGNHPVADHPRLATSWLIVGQQPLPNDKTMAQSRPHAAAQRDLQTGDLHTAI